MKAHRVVGQEPPDLLTAKDIEVILSACSSESTVARRSRALITLMAHAGLRVGEALALRPEDLDQERGTIHIREGRPRVIGMDATASEVLARWMAARKEWGIADTSEAPAFCTQKGKPLEPAYVRQLLPRLAKKAGVQKRVHAMAFRNALAAQLAAEGVPIGAIQAVLGHSSPATTSRLIAQVTRVAPEDVVSMMKQRKWHSSNAEDTPPLASGKETTQKRPEVQESGHDS